MSEYGHVVNDSAAVLRLYARQNDDRTVIKSTVVHARKATRTRPSSIVRRVDPSIMHGPKSVAAMRRDVNG